MLYQSDRDKLFKTLLHLRRSAEYAQSLVQSGPCRLILVDNTDPPLPSRKLTELLEMSGWHPDAPHGQAQLITAGENLGFGAAHNLALQQHSHPFHLILNPDVYVPLDGVALAWRYCTNDPEVVLLTPATYSPDGERQCLLRPAPNMCDVFLRFLAMNFPGVRGLARYARYECRHLDPRREHCQIPSMSGCFMWCRTRALKSIGGFDPRFFLYYEDYDLSRRMAQIGRTVYYPSIQVVHDWERMILYRWRLRYYNLRSAIRYFKKWGWKWW